MKLEYKESMITLWCTDLRTHNGRVLWEIRCSLRIYPLRLCCPIVSAIICGGLPFLMAVCSVKVKHIPISREDGKSRETNWSRTFPLWFIRITPIVNFSTTCRKPPCQEPIIFSFNLLPRSEEPTSDPQSLIHISYAFF